MPPRDSLIPSGHSTGSLSLTRGRGEVYQDWQKPPDLMPQGGWGRQEEKILSRSPLSPDKESQNEETKSVINAVKQITRAQERSPRREGVTTSNTPEYDWDSRYDGIHGFST